MKNKYFALFLFIGVLLVSANIKAQVTVNSNVTGGCRPLDVFFTAGVPTNATTFVWSYGDGTPNGTAINPNHVYALPGQYLAELQAYDANSNFLGNNFAYITVNGFGDSLNSSATSFCPGDNYSACLQIWGVTPNIITWNFGDGYSTMNDYTCSPSHVYTTPGTYTVKCAANSVCGTDTAYAVLHVSSTAGFNHPPQFYVQSDSVCPGDQAVFETDWNYQNFSLNFGDGTIITQTPNPNGNNNTRFMHTYATPGNYPANITYFNSCGNSIVERDTIHVVNHLQVEGTITFEINYGQHYDTACINSTVQFYPDQNGFHTYSWNFGGGLTDTSTQVSPTKKYAALGKFPVTLTITNGCGNTKSVVDTAKIVNTLPFGGLTSTISPTSICPGQAIVYSAYANNSNGNDPSISFTWSFGDGNSSPGSQGSYLMPNAGTYTVKCVGQNGCGTKDSSSQVITVTTGLTPVKTDYHYECTGSSRPACPTDSLVFIFAPAGTGTVHWDFGDATNANATQTLVYNNTTYLFVKHAYQANGHYIATVTYTNPCGNSFSDTTGLFIAPHVSNFGNGNGNILLYDNTVYPCQGTPIPFYALQGSTYVWNFGDGTGTLVTHSTLAPVYHAFQNAGKYLVTVRAYNACGNSAVDSTTVNIPNSSIKITTNSVNSQCLKADGKAIAVASGGTAPYKYQWSNGQSTFIDDSIPAGIYVINITDKNGCSNFNIATVSDAQAPTITVSTVVDVSCYGGNNGAIALNLIGSSSPYTYHWSTGATSQDINNQVAGPKEITVTDANGCIATKSVNIGQSPPVDVSIVVQSATCGVANGSATAAVSGTTGPYNYNWSNNATTAFNTGLTPGNYSVTVVDNNGCLFYDAATVSNVGGPVIYEDSTTGTGCGNALVKIYTHAAGGTSPYTYSWSTGAATPVLSNGGVGNYMLTVTGGNGCKSVSSFNVTHNLPAAISLCILTVDSATNTNFVLWQNPVSSEIDHYNIYQESSQAGLYYLIDTVSYLHISQWKDPVSNPQTRSWKYKISVVDMCGDESALSPEHKTIHLNANLGVGGVNNLIWDEYVGFNYSSYNIYRYTMATGWVLIATVPASVLSYTDASPPANTLDYSVEAVANYNCNPQSHAQINTSRSNIKTIASASPTGVSDVERAYAFGLYPNPNDGNFTITYPYSEQGYLITVLNAVGQVIDELRITSGESAAVANSKQIVVHGLPAGLYSIAIASPNGTVHKKVVVR